MKDPVLPPHWPEHWSVDPAWHASDAFWDRVRPALFQEERWTAAETQALRVLGILGVTPPDPILDVACGPGRHAIPMARLGYRVTAVDRTASYLDELRRRADAAGLSLQTVRGDVRTLADVIGPPGDAGVPGSGFAGAIWLDNSVAYGSAEDDRASLLAIREALRPGARLVVEALARAPLHVDHVETQWVDGVEWTLERRVRDAWMEVRWGPPSEAPLTYRHRLLDPDTMAQILRETGFRNVLLYNDLNGSRLEEDDPLMFLVAEA